MSDVSQSNLTPGQDPPTMLDSNRLHPLAVPEILSMIGELLDRNMLTRCLRVSRTWHAALLPRFWASLQIDLSQNGRRPLFDQVFRHAMLVRELEVACGREIEDTDTITVTFPALTSLTILYTGHSCEGSQVALIRRHKHSLTSLNIRLNATRNLLRAVKECPKLKSPPSTYLSASASHPAPEGWLTLYTGLWSKIRELRLYGSFVKVRDYYERQAAFIPPDAMTKVIANKTGPPRIRDLFIAGCLRDAKAHLWIIQQCHQLSRLVWDTIADSYGSIDRIPVMRHLGEAIAERKWSCEKLETLRARVGTMNPTDLITVLDHLAGLTELDVTDTNFDHRCWRALYDCNREHLFTLKVLRVGKCMVDGDSIIEILGSLPNLEVLEAGRLTDKNLQEDSRPWVCKRLRELSIHLVLTSRYETQQTMVFSRLAEMTHLETLELKDGKEAHDRRLQFLLARGMDQLHTLRRLKKLVVVTHGIQELWGAEEARWVRKHWPELRELQGFVMLPHVQQTVWLAKNED